MIPRMSKKKLASLGGVVPFSTISSAPKRIRKKPRSKSEFARSYGSKERAEFVKSLPCAACGVVGYSENAHVLGNGGLSRKGDYTGIAPLCGPHQSSKTDNWLIGCHRLYHKYGKNAWLDFDPEKAAAACESRWLAAHPKQESK